MFPQRPLTLRECTNLQAGPPGNSATELVTENCESIFKTSALAATEEIETESQYQVKSFLRFILIYSGCGHGIKKPRECPRGIHWQTLAA